MSDLPARAQTAAWLAALWPALTALFCLVYALQPQLFAEEVGRWIAFAAVGEIPALFLGVVHAMALREGKRGERYFVFGIGLLVLALLGGGPLLLEMSRSDLGSMLGWILIGMGVELYSCPDDPQLAHDRAWAIVNDRGTLLGLIPSLVVGSVLLATMAKLGSLAFGLDGFDAGFSAALQQIEGHHLALLAAAYLVLVAASTVHAHGQGFLQHRRRLLDRPWINALTRSSRKGE